MSAALLPAQRGLYAVLTASPGVGYAVFDDVPAGETGPYIVIGDDTAIDWGAKGNELGEEITLTLHHWSSRRASTADVARGVSECKTMAAASYRLLHMRPFEVEGFTMTDIRMDFSQVLRDPDGTSSQAVVRYRALLQAQS